MAADRLRAALRTRRGAAIFAGAALAAAALLAHLLPLVGLPAWLARGVSVLFLVALAFVVARWLELQDVIEDFLFSPGGGRSDEPPDKAPPGGG